MKIKLLIIATLLTSNPSFGADCNTLNKDLKKAVFVPAELVTCVVSKKDNIEIISGKYSTGLTLRTGNHIPYKAFYKNNILDKIEFFNDPSDVYKP